LHRTQQSKQSDLVKARSPASRTRAGPPMIGDAKTRARLTTCWRPLLQHVVQAVATVYATRAWLSMREIRRETLSGAVRSIFPRDFLRRRAQPFPARPCSTTCAAFSCEPLTDDEPLSDDVRSVFPRDFVRRRAQRFPPRVCPTTCAAFSREVLSDDVCSVPRETRP
jgi:hypothetical protein